MLHELFISWYRCYLTWLSHFIVDVIWLSILMWLVDSHSTLGLRQEDVLELGGTQTHMSCITGKCLTLQTTGSPILCNLLLQLKTYSPFGLHHDHPSGVHIYWVVIFFGDALYSVFPYLLCRRLKIYKRRALTVHLQLIHDQHMILKLHWSFRKALINYISAKLFKISNNWKDVKPNPKCK